MKTMLTLAIVVILATAAAGPAAAHDLGHRAPAKPAAAHQPPPADPGVLRQGGDTIAEAVPIAIPYDGAGTTAGYTATPTTTRRGLPPQPGAEHAQRPAMTASASAG